MSQRAFAEALLNPDAPMPAGLLDPAGRPTPSRFAIYRNNVVTGLTRVLEAGFPVVRRLVGPDFFAATAREFLQVRPPRSRIMMLYGAAFADFLRGFPPVAHLPYLPDVAALEQALRESYHAADAPPLDPRSLALLPEADLMASRFTLAPALRLIRSNHPVHAIWLFNTADGPPPQPGPQDVLVLRQGFDPVPQLLHAGEAEFLLALLAGETLATALSISGETFDLTRLLGTLLPAGALTGRQT